MKKNILLSIRDLKTYFKTSRGEARAVDGVSFDIEAGKTLAIVGESGCGKTVSALSILRLIQGPSGNICGGKILFNGVNLLDLSEREIQKIRGNKISMIFQEPMTSLNPVMTIGEQIMEVTMLHKGLSKKEATENAISMLDQVKIHDPKMRINEYPHQLSGGMKQRIMIAMALSCEPDLLIADEPSTALDVTVQAQILKLMRELQEKKGTAILLITHDMGVVYEAADHIAVMYAGRVIESADRTNFFKKPFHPYTKKLFLSLPDKDKRKKELSTIPGMVADPVSFPKGCRFSDRCDLSFIKCSEYPKLRKLESEHMVSCHLEKNIQEKADNTFERKETETNKDIKEEMLTVKNLKVHYPITKGIFKKISGYVKAVDDFSIEVKKGETVALVGESGCGKTTAGKGIIKLIDITDGEVLYQGKNLADITGNELRKLRSDIQIMFQDPYGSLNPRMMVNQIISEGLVAQKIGKNQKERDDIVKKLMKRVGLDPKMRNRYPHEFSGGQRQRVGIARFLAVRPKFVICDEVTSALDVSVQAQILNLLKKLQIEENLSYIFITHDLSVVSYIADRVCVMYLGKIVEEGTLDEVFDNSKHPYTKGLIASSPKVGEKRLKESTIEGEVPSPINPPTGCHFHPRCSQKMDICEKDYPDNFTFSKTQKAKCWLYLN